MQKLASRLLSLFSAAQLGSCTQVFEAASGALPFPNDDAQPTCQEQPFCDRFAQYSNPNYDPVLDQSHISYNIQTDTIAVDNAAGTISGQMALKVSGDGTNAELLDFRMHFYQNGIFRMVVDEPDSTRFRISDEDLCFVEGNLRPADLTDKVKINGAFMTVGDIASDYGDEAFSFFITIGEIGFTLEMQEAPKQRLIAGVNFRNNMYFETERASTVAAAESENEIGFPFYKDQIDKRTGRDVFRDIPASESGELTGGVRRAVGMEFLLNSDQLFGLGEREDTLVLKQTTTEEPYEMWAYDEPHTPDNPRSLYGNMPFVQGASEYSSAAVVWMNSAHTFTWIDYFDEMFNPGEFVKEAKVRFVSESGAMEFFLLGSRVQSPSNGKNRVHRVQEALATVTGFAPLPPVHTLGFHYSKWDVVSADIMMERSKNFTAYEYPVDVLVMDILWANQNDTGAYEYFKFNPQNFTADGIAQMNKEIGDAGRYITTILDPHIMTAADYFVYSEGQQLQSESTPSNLNNIFIKEADADADQEGDCWPGNSVWIDFLNENAQAFWQGLYAYEKFEGSSPIYHAWNDMNEPSVFNVEMKTMPLNARHFRSNGEAVEHRELHNAYGALQQRSSFLGLLHRDNLTLRPFVLTRSFFLGSQRWGAHWTGDNFATEAEVFGSVKMIMQNGLGGNIFSGADIPGFIGEPTDDVWIRMYQTGIYYPFMRAHCTIDNVEREPWVQSERVQKVIRASINRRYDLIHYIYGAFEKATREGTPLMRPMWMEFPDDKEWFAVETQFMFGDRVLVAPKIKTPSVDQESRQVQPVDFNFPAGHRWYCMDDGEEFPQMGLGQWVKDVEIGDLQQLVFIMGGSIVPILEHDGCYALSKCIDDAVHLEVFLDEDFKASGELYLDDGTSLEYKTDAAVQRVGFTWSDDHLTSTKLVADTPYEIPSTKTVAFLYLYGYVEKLPTKITQGGVELQFKTIPKNGIKVDLPAGVMVDALDLQVTF